MLYLHLDSNWEKDYIFKNLLSNIDIQNYWFVNSSMINDKFIQDISNMKDDVILSYSTNTIQKYEIIESICKIIKPKVIFMNSDEFGNCNQHEKLANHTNLLFRQYCHHNYNNNFNNIYNYPVSYNTGIFKDGLYPKFNELTPSSNRNYVYSFIGTIKSDRREAISMFSKLNVNNYCGYAKRNEIKYIYGDSIFVLSPRGNINLMCSRTFEAICLGAIPVIVGSEDECYRTYNFNDEKLPFVIAQTWNDALEKCKALLSDTKLLHSKQKENYIWFDNINKTIKSNINYAIK